MHKYGFILGRKWKLSVAELQSVFGAEGEVTDSQIWINDFKEELDPSIQHKLGGTINIIRFFDEVGDINAVEESLINHLQESDDNKVIFALNLYNFNRSFLKIHKNLLKNLKRKLKDSGRGARFLNKPNQNIKSVVIHEEKLDLKKTDLNVLKYKEKYLIGYTIAVQNFKSYSFRDYERPARDAKSGMLPPKLAQIMINLACPGETNCVLYDPFCGSGTILMEGLLMDKKVTGSDISEKAIADSQKNLTWLKKHFEINRGFEVFLKNALKIKSSDFGILPTCIASEVYLGPPQSKFPSEKEIYNNFIEIENLIVGALGAFKSLLKKGSIVVLAVPFYNGKGRNYFMEKLIEKVKMLGYDVSGLFEATKRGSLLYDRDNQIVGREIFKLKLVVKVN